MRKSIREMIEVMEAFERGDEVEAQTGREGHWGRLLYTEWNWSSNDYRIKRKPRNFLVSTTPSGWCVTPINCNVRCNETIKVVEVLE